MPELIFIAVIALIVLGPQRLPGVMRDVAKFIAQLRLLTSELTSQFSEEIAMIEELDPRKLIDEATKPINDAMKAFDPKNSTKTSTKSTNKTATSVTTKSTAAKSSGAESSAADDEAEQQVTEETKADTSSGRVPDALAGSVADGPSSGDGNDDGQAADLVEEVLEVDDGKPKPQMQTEPSNAASTEPYKNRTPKAEADAEQVDTEQADTEPVDSGQADLAAADRVEENSMIPPDMQTRPVLRSIKRDGATASSLAAGKQIGSNGHKSSSGAASSDDKLSESTTAEEELLDL